MKTQKTYPQLWFYIAACGLGLCIASTKIDRSTALWAVSRMDLSTVFIVILTVLLGICVLVAVNKRKELARSYVILGVLNVLQVFYFLFKSTWFALPWASVVSAALSQVPVMLFLIFAAFFLKTGVKKSIMAFVLGIIIAGIFQMSIALVPVAVGLAISWCLLPVSTVLLIVASHMRTPAIEAAEEEDIRSEAETTTRSIDRSELIVYCLSLFLLNTLGMILYCSGLQFQGSGNSSVSIQVLSGAGTLVGGLILIIFIRYLQSFEVLEMLRLILFPVLIAVIYISSLLGDTSLFAYFIPLGAVFASLLLFVWAVPRMTRDNKNGFFITCVTYVCFRLGWAVGITAGSILPRMVQGFPTAAVIIVCFVLLLVLIARSSLKTLRNERATAGNGAAGTSQIAKPAAEKNSEEDEFARFAEACDVVCKRFGLSSREEEVFSYLARGRNAKYIAKKLIISEGTARTHINHIYAKMNIRSQQALMDYVEEAEDAREGFTH